MSDPVTRYAMSSDLHIAYQVFGEGPLDLVYAPGFISHVEMNWELPYWVNIFRRLSRFSRVIVFDKRGSGLSDPVDEAATLEERMDDIRAVMDAAGCVRADVFGTSEGAAMAALFAASHPDRVSALVLFASFARFMQAVGYPWGFSREAWESAMQEGEQEMWGQGLSLLTPSRLEDEALVRWWGRFERQSMSPRMARSAIRLLGEFDIRGILPTIHLPTLVIHRTDDVLPVGGARWFAAQIPGARFVELAGDDHWPWISDPDEIVDEIEQFLTGERPVCELDRVLATVLFTDIVSSTERATALGDRRWRDLLDQHDRLVRREVDRHRGQAVKSTGDGVLATFDGPARGINCARAICDQIRPLGIAVRAGLHTGECELRNGDVGGIAVQSERVSQAWPEPERYLCRARSRTS